MSKYAFKNLIAILRNFSFIVCNLLLFCNLLIDSTWQLIMPCSLQYYNLLVITVMTTKIVYTSTYSIVEEANW